MNLQGTRELVCTESLDTGPSSNGRTLVFGTSYVGSNPAGPASFDRVSFSCLGEALLIYVAVSVVAAITNRATCAIGSEGQVDARPVARVDRE